MKPLFHPSIEDITVEGILHALSDPVRVAIFIDIARANCARNCSNFLEMSGQSVPKSTLSQHFKALREAGLIKSQRQGVQMHNTSRCAEIEQRFPGLLPSIINAHQVQEKAKSRSASSRRRPARLRD